MLTWVGFGYAPVVHHYVPEYRVGMSYEERTSPICGVLRPPDAQLLDHPDGVLCLRCVERATNS